MNSPQTTIDEVMFGLAAELSLKGWVSSCPFSNTFTEDLSSGGEVVLLAGLALGSVASGFEDFNIIREEVKRAFFAKSADYIAVDLLKIQRRGFIITTPEYRHATEEIGTFFQRLDRQLQDLWISIPKIEESGAGIGRLKDLLRYDGLELKRMKDRAEWEDAMPDEEFEMLEFAYSAQEVRESWNDLSAQVAEVEQCPIDRALFVALALHLFVSQIQARLSSQAR